MANAIPTAIAMVCGFAPWSMKKPAK